MRFKTKEIAEELQKSASEEKYGEWSDSIDRQVREIGEEAYEFEMFENISIKGTSRFGRPLGHFVYKVVVTGKWIPVDE